MRSLTENHFYHICTDGECIPWLFRDDEDFIAGVNRIGICYLASGLEGLAGLKGWAGPAVLAYVLMDNHVHFVLYGNMLQCKKFINLYKNLTGRWIRNKYGFSDYLRLLPAQIIRIESEESLLNTLAYLDRNAVVAGYPYLINEYPWGSARYMFRDGRNCPVAGEYRLISSFSRREQRQLFKSNIHFPDTWHIDNNGMIDPTLFVDIPKVESYFKTATRYSFYLSKKLEGIVNKQLESAHKVFLPDKEMRAIVSQIASRNYGTSSVRDLDINARLSIARQLRYNYAATVKQISRMLHLNKSALEEFI